MAERQLSDVPDILEENVFDSGMSIMFSMSGRFRDIDSLLVRNAISKAIIHAEDSDPADSHLVAGLTQYWINTTSKARFISDAGGAWVNVTSTGTPGDGDAGDDGWTPVFAIVSDDTRRVQQVSDWTGGGGNKPATGQYVGAAGFVSAIADAVDIRGPVGGTGDDGDDGDGGWSPEIAIISDGARRVQQVVDWHGGSGTKPAINQYLGEDGFTTELNLAIDIRGPDGLASLVTDATLQGSGTSDSPLGVVSNEVTGEIGRIHSIGSYTFSSSANPTSGNAGWSSNSLHVHMTDGGGGDNSGVLGSLALGDYLHIGTSAIVEIIAAPTDASGVYSFSASVLKGTVPTSGSHTLYYIKENRAIIAGAIHGFNIGNGEISLAKLAADVLANWLSSVSTDATIDGDGTPQSPLSVVAPASDDSPPDVDTGMYETFGSWAWTSTSAPATGQFYVEATELKIFETDSDSTDKRTALDDVAVGDRFQFGELNAFEATAVGVRSGNGIWTFTGNWAEVFDVGDFDGSYSVRYIKKANILARNNVVPGRFLKLNSSLLVESNDPEDSIEPLWEGSLGSASVETANNLNAGKKFSDYTHIIFNYSGSNKRNLWEVPRKVWTQLVYVEVSNKDNHLTVKYINDTSFEVGAATGGILLRKIQGYKGV